MEKTNIGSFCNFIWFQSWFTLHDLRRRFFNLRFKIVRAISLRSSLRFGLSLGDRQRLLGGQVLGGATDTGVFIRSECFPELLNLVLRWLRFLFYQRIILRLVGVERPFVLLRDWLGGGIVLLGSDWCLFFDTRIEIAFRFFYLVVALVEFYCWGLVSLNLLLKLLLFGKFNKRVTDEPRRLDVIG